MKGKNETSLKKSHDDDVEKNEEEEEKREDLQMEVYEDKEYDIEEVKFWNFISKSKGRKSNVIRTLIYKVPKETYVVRKSHVKRPSRKSDAHKENKSIS